MDELARRPDDPDAVDRDPARLPDTDEPGPDEDRAEDEGMMRFPGEEAPDVVGSGQDASDVDAPDATGAIDDPS